MRIFYTRIHVVQYTLKILPSLFSHKLCWLCRFNLNRTIRDLPSHNDVRICKKVHYVLLHSINLKLRCVYTYNVYKRPTLLLISKEVKTNTRALSSPLCSAKKKIITLAHLRYILLPHFRHLFSQMHETLKLIQKGAKYFARAQHLCKQNRHTII